MNVRRVVLWLHRWVGLVAGLVILVAAVTGALLVIERPLHRWMEPSLYPAQPAHGVRASVENAFVVLSEKHPGMRVDGIGLPRGERDALTCFAGNRVFHFDPSSGELLGSRARRDGFRQSLMKLHTNLLAGAAGGTAVFVATILTIALALSGLWLWWPLRIGRFRRGANGRRFQLELHSVAGLYSSAFLLVIAITGVTLHSLHTEHPRIPFSAPPAAGSTPITLDDAILRAEAVLPGSRAVAIEMPGPNLRAPLRVQLAFPEDGSPAGRSVVFLDRTEGGVLGIHNARIGTLLERYGNLQLSLHTGTFAGMTTRILAFATCLALVLQIVSGCLLWWKRPACGNGS